MTNRLSGNVLTEYGIIIALVVILAIGAVTLLGRTTSDLFQNTEDQLANPAVKDYMSLQFGSASGNVYDASMGSRVMSLNAQTGMPSIGIATSSSAPVNATSIDGMVTSSQQTLTLATQMDQLALTITDPKTVQWLEKITQYTHYMAGAEGDYSGVQALTVSTPDSSTYTSANSLMDIYRYQQALEKLINSPPKDASPQDIQQITTLAMDAWNNAETFNAQLQPYLKNNGDIDNGALAKSNLANSNNGKMTAKKYDQLVKYDTLQQNVVTASSDGSATNTPALQSTLQDAVTLNNTTQSTP
ncbi:MAG TPA: hypothetical protein V6C52_09705 [Coleofasciculaceae cyanobacterium]|jgi:Flp pilus assembly pilin Flp